MDRVPPGSPFPRYSSKTTNDSSSSPAALRITASTVAAEICIGTNSARSNSAAGIAPNPAADKRALLRRVSYDLAGLPPSEAPTVILLHVMGMFVPSFFTGNLITRFGTLPVMGTGALVLLFGILTALAGLSALAGPPAPKKAGIEARGYTWNAKEGEKIEALKLKGDAKAGEEAYEVVRTVSIGDLVGVALVSVTRLADAAVQAHARAAAPRGPPRAPQCGGWANP